MATQAADRPTLLEEFKEFVLRGNVLDLAIAIVIGIAFGTVVNAFVNGVLMALVAAIFGQPSFDALVANVGDGQILYGSFITATINFLIVAAAMFMVVKVAAALQRPKTLDLTDEAPDEPSEEIQLLREIRDQLARERTR